MKKLLLALAIPSVSFAVCLPPTMGNNTFLNSAAQAQFDQCLAQESYQQQQLLIQQQQLELQRQQLRQQRQIQQPQQQNGQPYQMPLFMQP